MRLKRIIIVGLALIAAEVLGIVAYYRVQGRIEADVEALRGEDSWAAEEARQRLQRMGRAAVKPLITALHEEAPGPTADRIAETLGNIGDPRAADALFQAAVFGSEAAAESLAAMKHPRAEEAMARARVWGMKGLMSMAVRCGSGEGTVHELQWLLPQAAGANYGFASLSALFAEAISRWRSTRQDLGGEAEEVIRRADEILETSRYWRLQAHGRYAGLTPPGLLARRGRLLARIEAVLGVPDQRGHAALAAERVPGTRGGDLVAVWSRPAPGLGGWPAHQVNLALVRDDVHGPKAVGTASWACSDGYVRAIGFSWEDIDRDGRPEAFLHSESQEEHPPGCVGYYMTVIKLGPDALDVVFHEGNRGRGPFLVRDLDEDGLREIIGTQTLGPYTGILAWADVWKWRNGAYRQADQEYPDVYRDLIAGMRAAAERDEWGAGQQWEPMWLQESLGECHLVIGEEEEAISAWRQCEKAYMEKWRSTGEKRWKGSADRVAQRREELEGRQLSPPAPLPAEQGSAGGEE